MKKYQKSHITDLYEIANKEEGVWENLRFS